jgi:chemotaxis signal transduction protein
MNVRGRVAAIVDLGLLLGGSESGVGAAAERILILEPRRRDVGLWVSEVLSIGNLRKPGEDEVEDRGHPDVEALAWEEIWRRLGEL